MPAAGTLPNSAAKTGRCCFRIPKACGRLAHHPDRSHQASRPSVCCIRRCPCAAAPCPVHRACATAGGSSFADTTPGRWRCGRDRRPCESLTVPWSCPYPVEPVDSMVMAVEAHCASHSTRRGVEGAAVGGLAPVKSRTAFEGRRPCPLKVLRRGKVKGWAAQWRGVSVKSAQSSTVPPRTGNSGTVVGAG